MTYTRKEGGEMKKECFEQVYEDHHKLILHVAFDILQDYDLAQKVCEKVFVEFYEKMERLGRWRVKSWLLERAQRGAVRISKESYKKKETSEIGKKEQKPVVDCLIETKDGG